MFCFRCKLIFEKKEKEEQSPQAHKAHMATKANKLTLYFPTRIT
jgi:phage FluMu protein Com